MDCGLIFDVDGVVADSESVNLRATANAFARLLGLEGLRRQDFDAGIGRGAAAYVRAGARSHGRDLTDREVAALVEARQQEFLAILAVEPLPAYPGVIALVEAALSASRIRPAIATSSTRSKSQAVLEAAGLPYRQMVYVCGDDLTRKKPDPEVFLVACDRLGLPPGRCVVIEDAPHGVAAARAAGCRCIAVTNTSTAESLAGADVVVETLSGVEIGDVRRLLEKS